MAISGIGIDIIEIDRVKAAIEKFGDSFLRRIYTDKEIKYCRSKNHLRYPELAVRFAAKEAYVKALGCGMREIFWKDIEVVNDGLGKPELAIKGKKNSKVFVSLSHSQAFAVANVIIEA